MYVSEHPAVWAFIICSNLILENINPMNLVDDIDRCSPFDQWCAVKCRESLAGPQKSRS